MIREHKGLRRWAWVCLLVGSVMLPQGFPLVRAQPAPQSPAPASSAPTAAEQMARMAQHYTPELRQKVMALSPEVRQALQQLQASHSRHSEVLTLRQVMQEILADYQSILAALAMDNAEHAAESARRLANHRLPRGGLLPYLPLDKITTETLAVLPAMNAAVEGSATQLAQAAEQGDMAKAARLLGDIGVGCVACHQVFRGVPGTSGLLLSPPATPAAR